MSLTCKNCGGKISIDIDTYVLFCDSCGVEQELSSVLTDESVDYIYENTEFSQNVLSTYKKGVSMMRVASSEKSFIFAAKIFDDIPGVLNSDYLAKECREKAEIYRLAQMYRNAEADMKSGDIEKVETAVETFKFLGSFKDAEEKKEESLRILSLLRQEYEEKQRLEHLQKIREEELNKKLARKKRFIRILVVSTVVFLILCIVVIYNSIYSSSNIKISLSPDEANYVTEMNDRYVFKYDLIVENSGLIDIDSIEGTVLFEKDDDVLVDTNISIYNRSSVLVRAQKNCKQVWELNVYSYDVALDLYETDFSDLEITIDITGITYSNGKVKTY